MKAADLRIGNLVTIDNPKAWPKLKGLPLPVCLVTGELDRDFPNSTGAVHLKGERETYSQFDEFIAPITLTEEWLTKFGFSILSEGYWHKNKIMVGYTTNDDVIQYEYLTGVGESQTEMLDLEFVHQLQNLFHSITGEELKQA